MPAARLAYELTKRWTVAIEECAALGPLRRLEPLDRQAHTLFAVVDCDGARTDVELGLGFGLTGAADALVLKLVLSREF